MKREYIKSELYGKVLRRDNYTCQYCGARTGEAWLEIDHIIPVSYGGDNNIDNLITACRHCNRKKRNNLVMISLEPAYWRYLISKEKNIDVVFLMKIAQALGTTIAYLVGETDNPALTMPSMSNVVIQTNAPSRKITSEPGRLSFNNGEVSIDMPDTPTNKRWFDDFVKMAMVKTPTSKREAVAIA